MKPYPKTSNFFWNKVSFISYSPLCSSSAVVHIIIRAYISKIADPTISAGVSKNSYSKARCVCNASIIFMELPSNLRNIHVFNASFDITITFPFYLKYSQTVLQDLSVELINDQWVSLITIRVYISKIADSTISAGV